MENKGEKKVLMTLEVLLERKDREIKRKMTIYPMDGLLSEPEFWETISELRILRKPLNFASLIMIFCDLECRYGGKASCETGEEDTCLILLLHSVFNHENLIIHLLTVVI
jgi:hypothetical protein